MEEEEDRVKGKKGEGRKGDKELENVAWHNKVRHLKP